MCSQNAKIVAKERARDTEGICRRNDECLSGNE